jgi:hypothetical protein
MTMVRSRTLVAALLSSFALGACVVAPVGYYDDGYGDPLAVADGPPPAPYYEVRPALPYVGAVWISGYWGWHSGRHHWVPGRWDQGRQGHVWRPHHWQPHNGRWALRGGGWGRRH